MASIALVLRESEAAVAERQRLQQQRGGFDLIGFVLVATFLGALEVVLDRGLEDDWLGSRFIVAISEREVLWRVVEGCQISRARETARWYPISRAATSCTRIRSMTNPVRRVAGVASEREERLNSMGRLDPQHKIYRAPGPHPDWRAKEHFAPEPDLWIRQAKWPKFARQFYQPGGRQALAKSGRDSKATLPSMRSRRLFLNASDLTNTAS